MFNKKSTLEKKTKKVVKNITKAAKKNPTAAVAVGGGIITAGIGSIVTSITLGAKLHKMKKTASAAVEEEAFEEEEATEVEVVEASEEETK